MASSRTRIRRKWEAGFGTNHNARKIISSTTGKAAAGAGEFSQYLVQSRRIKFVQIHLQYNLMRQQQQPQQPQPQQQQYIIQSHRDMTIGPPKVIEKHQSQVKAVESTSLSAYPNFSYAYPAAAAPKQYHKNEATAKVRKLKFYTFIFCEKSKILICELFVCLQSKVDTMLPNPPPLINQQQSIGVIVKHDTNKGTPIHVQSSQHLSIIQQQQQHQQHQHQSRQSRQPSPNPVHYTNAAQVVQNKPKVSSPAPAHIYGRPQPDPAKVVECNTLKSRQTFDMPMQVQHYSHGPHPHPHQHTHPPPAHSSRSIYESPRIFTTPSTIKPQQQQLPLPLTIHSSLSSPTNSSRSMSRSPVIRVSASVSNANSADAQSFQTQPLDLGVSDRMRVNSLSPKRKSAPLQHPSTLEIKYRRVQSPPILITEQTTPLALKMSPNPVVTKPYPVHPVTIHIRHHDDEPVKLREANSISHTRRELSPSLIVIANSNDSCSSFGYNNNNNHNAINCSTNTENKTTVSSSTNQLIDQLRTNSADGLVRVSSENSSPVPSPNSTQSAPATPAKLQSESEKSSSPGKNRIENWLSIHHSNIFSNIYGLALGAPRHLKKAWLQRHTGEDMTGSKMHTESITLVTSSSSSSSSSNEKTGNDHGMKTRTATNNRNTESVHSFDVGALAVNSKNKSIGD